MDERIRNRRNSYMFQLLPLAAFREHQYLKTYSALLYIFVTGTR